MEKEMPNFLVFLLIFIILSSCETTRVSVVDGYIVKKEKIIRLTSTPDTIYYRTLWNDEVITEEEYDRRWERALKRAEKRIKREYKIK